MPNNNSSATFSGWATDVVGSACTGTCTGSSIKPHISAVSGTSTGANTGDSDRAALILTFCGPQYRPQENYTLGTRPELLDDLPARTRALLGFKVWWAYGRTGDPTVDFIDPRAPLIGELHTDDSPWEPLA